VLLVKLFASGLCDCQVETSEAKRDIWVKPESKLTSCCRRKTDDDGRFANWSLGVFEKKRADEIQEKVLNFARFVEGLLYSSN